MSLKLAVIGDPVAHSRSPEYQRGFLAEAGLSGTYEAIRVAAGTGAARIEALRAAGYLGLNVTTPLKEEAFARADVRDPIATASGAVNTLVLGTRIDGYNTDGAGALGALADAGLSDPAGRRILVLGAGPTARAVAFALARANVDVFVGIPRAAGA
jgi:shikimate dehydrogenase